jgi:hypothetical protein
MLENPYTENRQPITMSHTKFKKQIYQQRKQLRFIILMLGVSVSVFAITSNCNKISASGRALEEVKVQLISNDNSSESTAIMSETTVNDTKPKYKIHHNFIVSYLFQESSIERVNKNPNGQSPFVSNLKQMHQVIIKHTLGKM